MGNDVLAPAVQTLNGAIHRTNRYIIEGKYQGNYLRYGLDRDSSYGYLRPPLEQLGQKAKIF